MNMNGRLDAIALGAYFRFGSTTTAHVICLTLE